MASPEDAERVVDRMLQALCLAHAGSCEGGLYRTILRLVDRSVVEAGLRRARGSQVEAARLLGISRNTLRSKMGDLGIDSWDYA